MSDTALAAFDLTAMQGMADRIKQLKAFMDENLEKGIDWENTHEVFKKQLRDGEEAKPMLLDPGCAKIMNFMGVRPRHRVLEMQIDKEGGNLRYVIAVEIVTYLPVMYHNQATGTMDAIYPVVAEGLGSGTTREKRYKVRFEWWTERSLKADGYSDADLADYRGKYPDRYKEGKPNNLYYMASSEALGLDNTLIKMAAKRAAMDAVFQLPGVAGRYSQEVDLLEAQTGDRLPKPAEEKPQPEPEQPAAPDAALEELIVDVLSEFPEIGRDSLLAEAKALMEKSSGLYTTLDAALKVLWKRLKKGEKPAEKKEPPPPAPKPEPKPTPEPKPEDKKGETLTGKDGSALGDLVVTGKDLVFTPALLFNVDTPPFKSFLVDRVLEGMVTADHERVAAGEIKEPIWYLVKEDNYRIVSVEVHGFGGDRRLKEIASSLRWTFDKMLDKTRQEPEEQPDPGFSRASGETVMSPEEVKARAAVDGLTGSDQLTYAAEGGALKISVKKFLGDAWGPLNDALKGVGASWISVRPTHWEIPAKKPKPPAEKAGGEPYEVEDIIDQIQEADKTLTRESIVKQIEGEQVKAAGLLSREAAAHLVASKYLSPVEPFKSLGVEAVEEYLTEKHGALAMQRLAVTENSGFVMVEPYQSLTPTEQDAFDKSLRALGAEAKGDGSGWYIKKPKGK